MPAAVKQLFNIDNFGKLRMKAHSTQLGPGETNSMLNVDYDVPGARNKRKGYQKQYAASLGAGGIKGMFTYDPRVGDPRELIFWSTKAYIEESSALTEALTGLTAAKYSALQTNDQLFFLNGTNRKRYCASDTVVSAITAPATSATVAAGAAGVLTGGYKYKVVFENAAGEISSPSPASATLTLATQQGSLTAIPLGGAGVTKRRIYRTLAGATGYYYLVATINDNTTTTYTDNTPDHALTTRIDGHNFYPWGVTAPSSAPTPAAGAAGTLTGTYYYKVAFVDSKGGISNPSAASTSVSVANQKVSLTAIPTGAAGEDVAKRYLYRTEANQAEPFFYLASIDDNTTVAYTDDNADTTLDSGTEAEDTNAICPAGTFCFTWNARAWVGGVATAPQRIYPSKILRPEQFDTSIEIEASDGQTVTGGLDFGNCALLGKERGLYRLTGDVPVPAEVQMGLNLFKITKLKSHVGPVNHEVMQKVGAWALFLSKHEGIWCVLTPEDTEGVPNVVYAGEDVEPITKLITAPEDCFAYVCDNKYYLHCTSTWDGTSRNFVLVCDFNRSSPLSGNFWWSVMKYDSEFSCLHRRPDSYLYAGDADNGYVYKMGKPGDAVPFSDNGVAIDAYFYVPDLDFSFMFADAGVRDKLITKLWITVKRWGTSTSIYLLPYYNGAPGSEITVDVSEEIDMMPDLTRAGIMGYDTYRVNISGQADYVDPLFKHWGARLRNNTANKGMTVYKVGGEIRFFPSR